MGRPQSISPALVREVAFRLLRQEGAAALTARRIAAEIGCSTQPVFSTFPSMAELRSEMFGQAQRFVDQMFRKAAPDPDRPALTLGLATLRLAVDEPHLYAILAEQLLKRNIKPPREVIGLMRADPQLAGLSDELLTELHARFWIVTQGLVATLRPQASARARAQAETRLVEMTGALVEQATRGPHA